MMKSITNASIKTAVLALLWINIWKTGTASDINGSMVFDGKTRTYLLHIPTGYKASSPTPLVLAFHGLGANGSKMADITAFSPLADKEKFIVVYPDGINKKWTSKNGGIDDIGFISALIDKLSSDYNIDDDRIFATGASMGGMFTYRLGLELTDRIAAIGVVAGYLPGYGSQPFPVPSKPISVVAFHGTADPVISYSKGEESVDYWADFDDCASLPLSLPLPNLDILDGTTVKKLLYGNGQEDTEVELYKITNGGHTWPGTDSKSMPGKVCMDIDATEIIWDFFKNHSLNTGNNEPTVGFINPLPGDLFTAPASVKLKAIASDADGSIKKVQFFNNNILLKTEYASPYSYTWKNVTAGTYTMRVVATDNKGATSADTLKVTVKANKEFVDNVDNSSIKAFYDMNGKQFIVTKAEEVRSYDFHLFDISGEEILSLDHIQQGKKTISTLALPEGVYVYQVRKEEGPSLSGKFVIAY